MPDPDYDEIDRLIDTDPIALAARCRAAERLIETLAGALAAAAEYLNTVEEAERVRHFADVVTPSPLAMVVNGAVEEWRQWRFGGSEAAADTEGGVV